MLWNGKKQCSVTTNGTNVRRWVARIWKLDELQTNLGLQGYFQIDLEKLRLDFHSGGGVPTRIPTL